MSEPSAHGFERRAATARDHEGNIVGYYIDADLWREVRARLSAVEELPAKWRASVVRLREMTGDYEDGKEFEAAAQDLDSVLGQVCGVGMGEGDYCLLPPGHEGPHS